MSLRSSEHSARTAAENVTGLAIGIAMAIAAALVALILGGHRPPARLAYALLAAMTVRSIAF